ncbi:proline--tRNA ligase [Mycoplasma nasistruthionis]|uniref:Proline--tRNA ligase n=1 Tax=Mycoplasma nasistruthionis TaxID=353852 RepID=A0A5B7XWC0_9MOLU|nr:proline--tRNA ligase [Mycoplasma nasistruthionis]QCZ36814.1 proline--tRNA ligase [Mycoplasma nasistruthionis]
MNIKKETQRQLSEITPLEQDFSQWYTDVVQNGKLMMYGPAKGTMILLPNAYGIWENIQIELNKMFKTKNVQNVNLPLFIPESLFNREKDHIEGFNPELAAVTHVGDRKLDERLFVRPTSEVLFAELFKNLTQSYKDLPIIFNQWVNVVRWEKTTRPFLRSREFLWQEGHTIHADAKEARNLTKDMIKIYAKFLKDYLAIPTIIGKKTPHEKFAGACTTWTIEAMMKNGHALQAGTSHYLAQNFSKAFDISFKNTNNEDEFAYQTSWGVTTRLIGALIMTHGDNRGIIIPPRIAPIQVDILELFANKDQNVTLTAKKIQTALNKKFRVRVDSSDKNPGFKASNSEIQGVPLRIEIGPRDLANGEVTFVRRDTLEKTQVKLENIKEAVKKALTDIHNNLYEVAENRLKNNIEYVYDYETFKQKIEENKFVIAPFCCSGEAEVRIKAETGASTRCIPLSLDKPLKDAKCIFSECSGNTGRYVVFAKAY